VLAKTDDSLELLDLRRAWGLPAPENDDPCNSQTSSNECDPEAPRAAAVVPVDKKDNKLAPVPTT
jgi:hypothetical protein